MDANVSIAATLAARAVNDHDFQAACQRYAHGNGSSLAIAMAAIRATVPDLLLAASAAQAVLARQKWAPDSPDPEAVALRQLQTALGLAAGLSADVCTATTPAAHPAP